MMDTIPDLDTIRDADKRIRPYVHRTPVFTSRSINSMNNSSASGEVYFKCENLQKGGAFKFRGACNTVLSLSDDEASNGVITHSSGNHAAALSLAARIRNIPAYIIMPSTAPEVKKAAVAEYGGQITLCEPTLQARVETARKIRTETNSILVHPYDDYRIIAGAATAAYELHQEVPGLDYLLAPVGGGGMVSGSALITRYVSPETKVIACEPKNADDAFRSFQKGSIVPLDYPQTVADGLRTMLSEKTFGIIKQYVHDIITLTEEEIIRAMRIIWERMKIIIEPSSAVAAAPIFCGKLNIKNKKVGVILTGGNVDLERLPF